MAVRKQCKPKGCKASPKCEHPWWLDYQHRGKRYRMPVDDFAAPRMDDSAHHTVRSKQEAKDWERRFIAEIKAGRDPRRRPQLAQTGIQTVADLLDRYQVNYVEAEALRSAATVRGRLRTLKQYLGNLPVAALERPDEIQAFKG
jgi:hypothetical protein